MKESFWGEPIPRARIDRTVDKIIEVRRKLPIKKARPITTKGSRPPDDNHIEEERKNLILKTINLNFSQLLTTANNNQIVNLGEPASTFRRDDQSSSRFYKLK
jgi:hypothetical protein